VRGTVTAGELILKLGEVDPDSVISFDVETPSGFVQDAYVRNVFAFRESSRVVVHLDTTNGFGGLL
jgi:hypothetical protein